MTWGSVFADGVPWSGPCVTAGTSRICPRRTKSLSQNHRNFRFSCAPLYDCVRRANDSTPQHQAFLFFRGIVPRQVLREPYVIEMVTPLQVNWPARAERSLRDLLKQISGPLVGEQGFCVDTWLMSCLVEVLL